MNAYGTYIQQISNSVTFYEKGTVVDLLKTFNIVCQDFPFVKNPRSKGIPARDWPDEDGVDVYVPPTLPLKDYELDVTFLYVGTEPNIRADISSFIDFIYGRKKGSDADTVQSGRLAVYNEYVGMGRKDIVVSDVDNEIFYCTDSDPDALAMFKVKFKVYDPTTEITPVYSNSNGEKIIRSLDF